MIMFAAIVTGMLVFVSAALYRTDVDLLSSSRHMLLLSSYDIYSKVGTTVENTLQTYLELPEELTSTAKKESESIPSKDKNTVSPEIIRLNVDGIVNGMLQYFKGNTAFLPDIYLHPVNTASPSVLTAMDGNIEEPALKPITDMSIDKVNLSAILMYINRQDISNVLQFIRLLHQGAENVPAILLIMALSCSLYIALMAKSRDELFKSAVLITGTIGLSGIVTATLLLYWLKVLLPSDISILAMSLPLSVDMIIGYTTDLCKPVLLFLLLTGLLFPLSLLFPKLIKSCRSISSKEGKCLALHRLKYLFGILLVIFLSTAAFKSSVLLEDLRQKGFTSTYEKISGVNTQMKVIPAMNDTVYTLEIKLLEKNSGTPVSGALIEVNGKTVVDKKTIDLNKSSDTEGTARFSVQAGTFRIGFLPEMFPNGFILPAPSFVNITAAGTTTITINLEEALITSNPFISGDGPLLPSPLKDNP